VADPVRAAQRARPRGAARLRRGARLTGGRGDRGGCLPRPASAHRRAGAARAARPGRPDAYWAALNEPEGRRLTGTHAEFTLEQTERWLATRGEQHDLADWAAISRHDGESCGFRIALAGPHVYGRGFGTEITRLVVGYALDTVGLHRLQLEVYAFNPRAQRVYEKCGFRVEGRRRDALLWDGERVDVVDMGILRTDPRP
jgi:RimJ/RimL family protein N-acetyltransferase